jgi:inner membrane protein
VFAVLVAGAAVAVRFRHRAPELARLPLIGYLFLVTASHGALDAMTNGGLGGAFFSPFNNARYFLPWRPILVSPISFGRFFSPQTPAILTSEFLWIWIPAGLLAALSVDVAGNQGRDKG